MIGGTAHRESCACQNHIGFSQRLGSVSYPDPSPCGSGLGITLSHHFRVLCGLCASPGCDRMPQVLLLTGALHQTPGTRTQACGQQITGHTQESPTPDLNPHQERLSHFASPLTPTPTPTPPQSSSSSMQVQQQPADGVNWGRCSPVTAESNSWTNMGPVPTPVAAPPSGSTADDMQTT